MDALLAALREAGFSAETTYHAYHVLDAHIIGFSLWQSTHGSLPVMDIEDVRAFLDRMLPEATYPHLHEHGMQHLERGLAPRRAHVRVRARPAPRGLEQLKR